LRILTKAKKLASAPAVLAGRVNYGGAAKVVLRKTSAGREKKTAR
jgi:hypothetical protein